MMRWRPMEPVGSRRGACHRRSHPSRSPGRSRGAGGAPTALSRRAARFSIGTARLSDTRSAIRGNSATAGAQRDAGSVCPPTPTTYYLHDLAIAPAARGTRTRRRAAVERLADLREDLGLTTCRSWRSNASRRFWEKFGFEPMDRARPGNQARELWRRRGVHGPRRWESRHALESGADVSAGIGLFRNGGGANRWRRQAGSGRCRYPSAHNARP